MASTSRCSRNSFRLLRIALRNSLLLGTTGLAFASLLGMSVGALQGWRPRSRVGQVLGGLLSALYAAPEFIVAISLITLFAYRFALFPIGGISDPVVGIVGSQSAQLRDALWHLALPALTLAIGWGAAIARQQRASLEQVAGAHHVRTARAKGVAERLVFSRHAFRPSLTAVIVVIGLMLPELVGGAVIVETLFAWPGLGSLLLRSIAARDYPTVSASILAVGMLVALAGIGTDATIAALDPRARAQVR
jgi:peptide/nickel transport system permease protein